MDAAFSAAKAALNAAVPLVHPLPGATLSLATDASDTHVGAVLQQQVGHHWQPLGFYSKKLSKTEVNYSTFDRELLALVSGIKHFFSRLEGRVFQLWTDHKPLIFALNLVLPCIWPPAAPFDIYIRIHKQSAVCARYAYRSRRRTFLPVFRCRRCRCGCPGLSSHRRQGTF
jgi:hypothetical protein